MGKSPLLKKKTIITTNREFIIVILSKFIRSRVKTNINYFFHFIFNHYFNWVRNRSYQNKYYY